MKGLIVKDWYITNNNILSIIFMAMAYSLFLIFTKMLVLFVTMNGVVIMIFWIAPIGYDEINNWNKFALTTPVERKDIIKGKFLTIYSNIIILTLVMIVITGIYTAIVHNENFIFYASTCLISFVIKSSIVNFTSPFIYKYGLDKGFMRSIALLAILIGIIIMVFLEVDNIDFFMDSNTEIITPWKLIILLIITAISTIISYITSVKIFEKKDL